MKEGLGARGREGPIPGLGPVCSSKLKQIDWRSAAVALSVPPPRSFRTYQRRNSLLPWKSTEPRGTLFGVRLSYHFSPSEGLLVSEGGVLAEFPTVRPRTCDPRLQTESYGGKNRDRLLALWEL